MTGNSPPVLATEAMRVAPARFAGAASGVLNTGRQLGGTLGGAVTGAVLAAQLASAMRVRALADARVLPRAARPGSSAGSLTRPGPGSRSAAGSRRPACRTARRCR
jgi:hypothetical protein